MSYKIVGDSCCDYPEDKKAVDWLTRVPLNISVNGESFVDDNTLNTLELIEKMHASPDAPSTSCPSPERFMDSFDGEAEDVYVVTLSDRLSGSYNSAVQASKLYTEERGMKNIHIFNSRSASASQIAICRKIHELAEKGYEFLDVVKRAEGFIDELTTFFVLEDLDVLYKNGRLTGIGAFITDKLKVKLVMGGAKDGSICKFGQALSIKHALTKMVALIADKAKKTDTSLKTLVISHCNSPDRAEFVREKVLAVCKFKDAIICRAGGISTVYANSGGIIVGF